MSWIVWLLISTSLLGSYSQTISPNESDSPPVTVRVKIEPEIYDRCSEYQFRCQDNITCINLEKFCDRNKDCADGSDEYPGCTNKKTCMDWERACDNGYCVLNHKICDGIDDCQDNSDELNCHINRCQKNFQLCDQNCIDKNNTYECACQGGYELQADKKTCKVAKHYNETLLVYSTRNSIRVLSLPSMSDAPLVRDIKNALAVTMDALHVYWSVDTPGMNAIYRSLLHQNQPQAIVTTGLGFVQDIAVDWVTSNIYFVDGITMKIGVCTNSGSHCTIIFRELHPISNGIALDPANAMMYWCGWRLNAGYIGKSNMNGENLSMLVESYIGMPQSLAIDIPNKRLYWRDTILGHVASIQLDGKNRHELIGTDSIAAQSIAIFENRMYWSDHNVNTIESCDKFTCKNRITLVKNVGEIRGMHVHHSLLKPDLHNPCKNNNCSELCLLAGNNSYTCACSMDKELSEDMHTCRILSGQKYLMVLTNSIYFNYYGELIGRPPTVVNKLSKHFTAATYDSLNPGIFANDLLSSLILRYDKKTEKTQSLDGVKNQHIGGMSFDYIGNNLYWSNVRKNTIEIYSLETKQQTTLHYFDEPRNILVIPEFATMIVAFCKNSTCRLEKLSMDGSGTASTLVATDLLGPRISLVFDDKSHRIFWADQGTGNLESSAIDGSNRQLMQSGLLGPVSLSILDDNVYWTLYNNTIVFQSPKNDNNYHANRVMLPFTNKSKILHLIMTNDHSNELDHPCRGNNGGCSHVCLISDINSRKCACPNGVILKSDNLTCEPHRICIHNEFKCSDNSCINRKKVCDGFEDCPDSEDETNCMTKKNKCPNNDFQCTNGKCISSYNMCNGKNDCGDWTDEMNCAHYTCPDNASFKCSSSGLCIPLSWKCDGEPDCDDKSDEDETCDKLGCPNELYSCLNGMCIHHAFVCNNVDDCGDGTDETDCIKYDKELSSGHHCRPGEYRCLNTDTCIKKHLRCNTHQDCPQNDDEQYCSSCNPDYEFTCNNFTCILKDRVCDEYNDCTDDSDEEFCDQYGNIHDATNLSSHPWSYNSMMNNSEYTCNDGKSIHYEEVCDGTKNCADGSDEDSQCTNSCSINDLCEQRCLRTPKGPVCRCMNGYKLKADNHSCEDINECALGMCSQICHNEEGGFRCDCIAGFSLRYDQRTCKSINDTMEIITATTNDIRKISNNIREIDIIQIIPDRITGMDINIKEQLLYWSNEKLGIITEFNLKTRMQKDIHKGGKPTLIAVDWITNNVYFFNNEEPYSIMACSQFDRNCATIVILKNAGSLMSMAVDPIHGTIYWTQTTFAPNKHPTSKIYRSDMDGDNIKIIANRKIGIVSGIAVDYNRLELFWIDTSQELIMRSNLDGSNHTIFRRIHQPLSINIYEDSIYWIMRSTRVLYSCPLYEQLQCQPIAIQSSNIYDFLIISHSSRQPSGPNACEKNHCGWMCTIKNNNSKCICRDDDEVNSNNSLCFKHETHNTSSTAVKTINLSSPTTDEELSDDKHLNPVLHIIVIIFIVFIILTMCWLYKYAVRRILLRVYDSASISHSNNSVPCRRLSESDASVPGICSDTQELTNLLPRISSLPEPVESNEMVELNLPQSHSSKFRKNSDHIGISSEQSDF